MEKQTFYMKMSIFHIIQQKLGDYNSNNEPLKYISWVESEANTQLIFFINFQLGFDYFQYTKNFCSNRLSLS